MGLRRGHRDDGGNDALHPRAGTLFPLHRSQSPAPGALPTCETAGILGTAPAVVAALQATEAIKILCGALEDVVAQMRYVDVWAGTVEAIDIRKGSEPCPACDLSRFDFLQGTRGGGSAKMCGRTAVQLDPGVSAGPDFRALSERLAPLGDVSFNPYMLRFRTGEKEIVVFPDGRAIVKGTADEAAARAFYARFVGA